MKSSALAPAVVLFLLGVAQQSASKSAVSRAAANASAAGDGVVGGHEVVPHSFPFMASLRLNARHVCGASLLSPSFALTAAHCTLGQNVEQLEVLLGAHRVAAGAVRAKLRRFTLHPDYDPEMEINDIAVLQLASPVVFSSTVRPIAVWANNENTQSANGLNATVIGWGNTREDAPANSNLLLRADITMLPQDSCDEKYFGQFFENLMICGSRPGVDACQYDSGGPLLFRKSWKSGKFSGSYLQIGIVSWGDGCARKDKPGVYTRLAEFTDFITSTMAKSGLKESLIVISGELKSKPKSAAKGAVKSG